MKSSLLHLVPLILILFSLINFISADPPVTPKDRAALRRFRPVVENLLPHEYMKEDSYLLRWIRKKKYDLEGAKELLQKNIEWRKENNIDNWEYDPKSALAKDFPIRLSGVDNEGRPVAIQDWSGDFWKYAVAGKRKELSRHITASYEILERKSRELNEIEVVTGHRDPVSLKVYFGLHTSGLPVYLDHAIIEESYYPLGLKEAITVNTPRIFQTALRLVSPIIGDTIDRITTLGYNKDEWKRYLLERIPADQLPIKYGGTRQS